MHQPSPADTRAARLVARLQLLAGRFPSEAYFIRAAFRVLLDREPDGAALAHYRAALAGGATRADVYNDIVASAEYKQRIAPRLERDQTPPWFNRYLWLMIGLEEARLNNERKDFTPSRRFIHAAYRVLLRRPPDADALRVLEGELAAGKLTRADVFWALRLSPEFNEQQGLRLYPAARMQLFARVASETLRQPGARPWALDHERFLQAAYKVLLDRELDESGRQLFLDRMGRGQVGPLEVLDSISNSSEFKRRFDLPIRPLDAVHQARMMLFQTRLPPAEVIVDLGGAAHNEPRGALLMMGYPHRPREITILDLPPADRIGGVDAAEDSQQLVTEEGITVRYLYRSMADLDPIPDNSADLVVSGESIEHISEAEAEQVCDQAFRVLRSGGFFCLDTPNARLTRIQSPDKLIHPEHQKEYYPAEIRAKLEQRGFRIVDAAGICPMPESIRSGVFSFAEMTSNIALSDDPELGYMFYFKALKP